MGNETDRHVNEELLDELDTDFNESDVPCVCSQRWILAYLGFVFGSVFGMYRIDMSLAVVCMVRDNASSVMVEDSSDNINISYLGQNFSNEYSVISVGCKGDILQTETGNLNAEFTWDRQTQSIVLSAFFYGFVTSQIPGGWVIGRFGGKNVITSFMVISSLFTILTPVLARTHVTLVIIARILIGIVSGPALPAWFALVGKWALPNERGRMMMMLWIGQTAGSVLGISTSGVLCARGFDNGWGSIFYLHGIGGLVFVLFWIYFVGNTPQSHPRITQIEKMLLKKYLQTSAKTNEKVTQVPWVKALTSPAVLSIFITQLCDNWFYYLILTCLPLFVNEILKFDIQSNGLYSSLPFTATIFSLLSSGVLADFVNKQRWISRTTNRKIFQITSLIGSAGFLVLSSYIPCDKKQLVILCMSVCTFFQHIALSSGYPCNLVDMTPRYACYLYGISNTIGATPGFLAPLVVGFLTKNKTINEWRFVFWISSGIAGIGSIVYGLFSTSELLPWDKDCSQTIEIRIPQEKSTTGQGGHIKLEINAIGKIEKETLLEDGV